MAIKKIRDKLAKVEPLETIPGMREYLNMPIPPMTMYEFYSRTISPERAKMMKIAEVKTKKLRVFKLQDEKK